MNHARRVVETSDPLWLVVQKSVEAHSWRREETHFSFTGIHDGNRAQTTVRNADSLRSLTEEAHLTESIDFELTNSDADTHFPFLSSSRQCGVGIKL